MEKGTIETRTEKIDNFIERKKLKLVKLAESVIERMGGYCMQLESGAQFDRETINTFAEEFRKYKLQYQKLEKNGNDFDEVDEHYEIVFGRLHKAVENLGYTL